MLQSLKINNYALIDKLDISFENGFSVITGETGAGKSILLGAIGLLLGQRADLKMIKSGAQRCTVEARFDLSSYDFKNFFLAHDLDFDGTECIVRRELTVSGKSRAFINDTPTSLSDLKELGEQLIDIHSQHQNLLLNKEDFQLRVLDVVAQNKEFVEQYSKIYQQYIQAKKDLSQAIDLANRDKGEEEYLSFQLQQLREAQLKEGEEDVIEQELNTLEHAEDIKSSLFQTHNILDGEEDGLVSNLRDAQRQLTSIATVFPSANDLAARLESCYIEIRDIADEIAGDMEQVEYDPDRLTFLNDRISLLHNLKQKFHVSDIEGLIKLQDELSAKLNLIANYDDSIRLLQDKVSELETQLTHIGKILSSKRQKAAKQVEQEMCKRLIPLGMPNVHFEVHISIENSFTNNGCDKVTFLFSANKNIPLQPLSQVASGGEIARLMLALKAMISGAVKLPTIIFDEIDTGVSGQIAEKMAEIMKEMGDENKRQVISITHLPQIAAMGSTHYRVFKTDDAETTTSHIVQLSKHERIEELARMLSGSTLTQAAIDNAKVLLKLDTTRL